MIPEALPKPAKVGLDDFFAGGGTVEELMTLVVDDLPPLDIYKYYAPKDPGEVERFIDMHEGRAAWVPETKTWWLYEAPVWVEGRSAEELPLYLEVLDAALREAPDGDAREALMTRRGNYTKLAASIARGAESRLKVPRSRFDAEVTLLNTPDGTVEMEGGVLRDHEATDYLTLCTTVSPDATVPTPHYDRFMREVAGGDEKLRTYLLECCGMTLCGRATERKFLIPFGKSRAGKSTLMNIMAHILGEYAWKMDIASIQRIGHGKRHADLAEWPGKRFIYTGEPDDTSEWDEAVIKEMTSTEALYAEKKYQAPFNYYAQFTPWAPTNNQPKLNTADPGIQTRVVILPFLHSKTEAEQDQTLGKKLEREAAGILHMWISHYQNYLARGSRFDTPAAVRDATAQFMYEQNTADRFIGECLRVRAGGILGKPQAIELYKEFCLQEGVRPVDKTVLLPLIAGVPDVIFHPDKPKRIPQINKVVRGWFEGIEPLIDGGEEPPPVPEPEPDRESIQEVSVVAVQEAPVATGYELVDDAGTAILVMAGLALSSVPLAIDIETTGLDPRQEGVRLMSICDGENTYIFDLFALPHVDFSALFANREVIGHNLAFEFGFLPPVRSTRAWDTMLATQVLDAGLFTPKGHYALASVAERFAGVSLEKAAQLSDWSGTLTEDQLRYAASDVQCLHKIRQTQIQDLSLAGLLETAELEMRALMGISWMGRSGVPFDLAAWKGYAHEQTEQQQVIHERLREYADINWQSPKQVTEYFGSVGVTLHSTAESTLAQVARPEAALLLDYRGLAKATGTYGDNWNDFVTDGRIYAGWKQNFTATGRMSCAEPNLQNLPRDARVRACFRAGDGRVLVAADYSQIEARIAAVVSGDPKLLAVFHSAEDVYVEVARALLHKQDITKQDRQIAKSATLGLMFGMGAQRFAEYGRANFGLDMSDSDFELIRFNFFKTYKRLRDWQREAGADEITETRTLMGRRRLAPRFYSEKLNAPIQGTAADGIKAAIARLWDEHEEHPGTTLVMAVHDSLMLECDEAAAEREAAWLAGAMIEEMAALVSGVPIKVETTIAKEWK